MSNITALLVREENYWKLSMFMSMFMFMLMFMLIFSFMFFLLFCSLFLFYFLEDAISLVFTCRRQILILLFCCFQY